MYVSIDMCVCMVMRRLKQMEVFWLGWDTAPTRSQEAFGLVTRQRVVVVRASDLEVRKKPWSEEYS